MESESSVDDAVDSGLILDLEDALTPSEAAPGIFLLQKLSIIDFLIFSVPNSEYRKQRLQQRGEKNRRTAGIEESPEIYWAMLEGHSSNSLSRCRLFKATNKSCYGT